LATYYRWGDPVAYVLSLNLYRRHLTASQISMVGARAREQYDAKAKERQERKPKNSVVVTSPQQAGRSRDNAGKAVGVSGTLVDHATKVIKHGAAALEKAVDKGDLDVTTAAKFNSDAS